MSQNVIIYKKLEEILLTCQQIGKEVSPILGITSVTVEKINSLKKMEFSIPLLEKQVHGKSDRIHTILVPISGHRISSEKYENSWGSKEFKKC